MTRYILWITIWVVGLSGALRAEEVVFKNGDRVTGVILKDTQKSLTVQSQALGTLTIDRVFIESPTYAVVQPAGEKEKIEWSRKASIGYTRSGGNTVKSEWNAGLSINRKTAYDEFTFKASGYYSSADRKMDAQKYYGMLRYDMSLGNSKDWYNFYKLEADHDRFSDVDYRLLPTIGTGYWLLQTDEWKVLAEVAGGLEYTDYRSGKDATSKITAVPRGYLKKLLLKDLWFEQDLNVYLVADDWSQYRLRSESSVTHQFTKELSWKLSLIDEYNSDPASNTKENDYRIIYSLDYIF